ncbi:MAG: NAD-dependent epimerase/dehydratase family protein [Syntrophaceae bacterium]|nr:NAD-dependent epimerase/dehydratase family protein [Syntrophaceae bacterium]
MAVMITGGTGFIGSHLAEMLIGAGEKPVLFDIAPVRGPLRELEGCYIFERGSLCHLSVLMDAIERNGIDRIFHLGGMLSLPAEDNPQAAFDANVIGTWNVLEAARVHEIPQVIYGSTIATYSRDIPGDTIDDRTIQRPSSLYGITKTFGENLGLYYHRRYGMDFRGVRLPSVVGPGAKTAHMSIYNAWAIEYPLRGLSYKLSCSPETRCPVLYYKDAAEAVLSLSRAEAAAIETRVYNIAGITPPFSAAELVAMVERRISGARLSFVPDPVVVRLLREIGALKIRDDAAAREWGWRLSYPLEAMVEDFIAEFEQHRSYYE